MSIDTLLSDPTLPPSSLADPISLAAQGEFRWGRFQALLYDPSKTDIFPQPFLFSLYERTRLSGQRHPKPLDPADRSTLGLLPTLFCGMTNLGPDAICAYLSQRAVCVVGEWQEVTEETTTLSDYKTADDWASFDHGGLPTSLPSEKFHPLGYCFPSTPPTLSPLSLTGIPSNSLFAGYTLFSECWRQPSQRVMMILGLAWLFHTFKLVAILGSRYSDNHLTARWTRQFCFQDAGTLPYIMPREPGGELAAGTFSYCLRRDFEELLRGVLQAVRDDSLSTE